MWQQYYFTKLLCILTYDTWKSNAIFMRSSCFVGLGKKKKKNERKLLYWGILELSIIQSIII